MRTLTVARRLAVGIFLFALTQGSASPQDHSLTPVDSGRPYAGVGTVKSLVITNHSNLPAPSPITVPFWTGTFGFQGATYRFSMVGADPARGSSVTTVPVQIIPLRFEFADGSALDASRDITAQGQTALQGTLNSPLFQSVTWSTGGTNVGYTQFNDAMQRAQFWNYASATAPGYHVFLSPVVFSTQTIVIPQNHGTRFLFQGVNTGLVDFSWMLAQLRNLLGSTHADPQALALFVSYNVGIRFPDSCCIAGFHDSQQPARGQGRQSVQTYAYAMYPDPGLFNDPTAGDIAVLSHEMAEWMNDPFGSNIIPPVPVFGTSCNPLLEVADPLDGQGYPISGSGITYHLQDIAFLPWFERVTPSFSVNGYYSFRNQLPSVPPVCH